MTLCRRPVNRTPPIGRQDVANRTMLPCLPELGGPGRLRLDFTGRGRGAEAFRKEELT